MSILYGIMAKLQKIEATCNEFIYNADLMKSYHSTAPAAPEYRALREVILGVQGNVKEMLKKELANESK